MVKIKSYTVPIIFSDVISRQIDIPAFKEENAFISRHWDEGMGFLRDIHNSMS